jgi:peptidoglycan/xylan/chitin deacetylase (PgdA/CDA1 family)
MAETRPPAPLAFTGRVLVKALLLVLAANLIFGLLDPLPALGGLSLYNGLFPGRPRLPFGEVPDKAYNFSLFSLEAMFASHEISRSKTADEYRVVVVGDSSVWGTLLKPEETLPGLLNARNLKPPDGRRLVVYNLGYPTISLSKDVLLLSRLRPYQPDAVIWLTTLEAFPRDKQTSSPLFQQNPAAVKQLIQDGLLKLDPDNPVLRPIPFWQRTLFGQRRAIADLIRLQLYGIPWAATGIDQYYPETYERWANDLPADQTFHGLKPPRLSEGDLALEVLQAGMALYPGLPVLLVNEPMAIANGKNSDNRYNFFYPRWAYDDYRQMLSGMAQENGWQYLDLWDAVPRVEFTNSAIHLTPAGEVLLADRVGAALQALLAGQPLADSRTEEVVKIPDAGPSPTLGLARLTPPTSFTPTPEAALAATQTPALEAALLVTVTPEPTVTTTLAPLSSETPTSIPPPNFQLVYENKVLKKVDTTDAMVVLSIDDGLSKQVMREMLPILQDAGVKTTFFLTANAAQYRLGADLLKTMVEQGHEIGYHSVAHQAMDILSTCDAARWSQDYDEWSATLRSLLGDELYARGVRPYARAPYGLFTRAFLELCAQKGLEPVGWSCNHNCLLKGSKLTRGDIFLLHVIEEDVNPLKELIQRGYRLVPLSAILSR